MYKVAKLFERCWLISLFQWSDRWHRLFYSIYVKTLLALGMLARETAQKKWTSPHPDCMLVLFAARVLGRKEAVRYYYGSPV